MTPEPTPDSREALVRAGAALGRRTTNDPGAFVKRGPDYEGEPYGERLDQWQARALDAAVAQFMTEMPVSAPEPEASGLREAVETLVAEAMSRPQPGYVSALALRRLLAAEATVEALAKVLADYSGALSQIGAESLAGNVLASDWLAAHDAQVRADRDREWQVARDRLADRIDTSVTKGREDVDRGNDVWSWVLDQYAYDLRALAPDVAGEEREEGT